MNLPLLLFVTLTKFGDCGMDVVAKPLKNLKMLMLYFGIAWATAFISTFLLAHETSLYIKEDNWPLIRSRIKRNGFFFNLPLVIGRPRYFSWESTSLMSREVVIRARMSNRTP